MSTVYIFAETGNFDFSRHRSASRYFGVGIIVLRDQEPDSLSADMAHLRRELAWKDQGLDSCFHATEDKQLVRDEVFSLIARHSFRFDVTYWRSRSLCQNFGYLITTSTSTRGTTT